LPGSNNWDFTALIKIWAQGLKHFFQLYIVIMKLWILYFLSIYGAWDMFLSQLKVLHWCSPVSSVGKDGWKRWLE
jgi:hypothetical protein